MTRTTETAPLRATADTLERDNANTLAVFAEVEASLRSGVGPAEDDTRQPIEWALIAFDAFRSAVETQRSLMAQLLTLTETTATLAATTDRLARELAEVKQECADLRAARPLLH